MSYLVSVLGKFGPLTLDAKLHEKVTSVRQNDFKEINQDSKSLNDNHAPKLENRKTLAYKKFDQYKNKDEHGSFFTARAFEIMTKKVIVKDQSTTLSEIKELFSIYSFRHILLENDEKDICGIISDRDILKNESNLHTPAYESMTETVFFCLENTTIQDISRLMFEKKISCVPVANSNNKLIGIITQSDILRFIFNHETIRNLKV